MPGRRIGPKTSEGGSPSADTDLRGVGGRSHDSVRLAEKVWANWITRNGPWDWFCTLTFRPEDDFRLGVVEEEEDCLKIFRKWLGRVMQAHAQHRANSGLRQKPRSRWVVAVEPHSDGRIHLHCLIAACGLSDLSRFRWESRWEQAGGGMARILPAVGKAAPYLSKYVSKGGFLISGASGQSQMRADAKSRRNLRRSRVEVIPSRNRVSVHGH